ncbi:DNA/RNA non-specific endonuclease [Chromobacterium haemolyticum]|uniref:DNA/RNA non-specific endonuclease n=1 Tax=Chromobacterium fluminis TaxID=3044269 RepID=A0ABX0KY34_9NEIS|nr:DNA/RNA non-specific endonuclease [Chromobacterium haemolyticum]NHR04462.1 DNA/RNA non-specific endonuclease [Chromobacterium haemolyticum]
MKRILLLATNCLMLVGSAFGQPSSCPAHFAGGQAPELTNSRLSPRTQELCFEAFSSLHSGVTKSSLYSAEFLNRARIEAARSLKRRNSFHPEDQLRTGDRAELKDYSRSGYDRGQVLVPTGIFKAIYDPTKRMGAAYVVKNAPGMDYQVLSLEELETRVGLNVFPVVPTASKRSKLSLPEPKPSGYAGKGQKNPKLPDDRQIFRSAYYLKKLINLH